MPNIVLATLVLNEIQWLEKLYEQHRSWKGVISWIFIESADRVYAECSPDMVSEVGLSVDGTTQFLEMLSSKDERVTHIKHGFCGNGGMKDQGKCEARNRYLEVCDDIRPDYVIVLDADEFYTYASQNLILNYLHLSSKNKRSAIRLKQRHIWYPPLLQDDPKWASAAGLSLFSHEAVNGYWKVPHCRIWGWEPGMRYRKNHNWPEDTSGVFLTDKPTALCVDRAATRGPVPQCIHMGFAASIKSRQAKHKYYRERGEGKEVNPMMRGRRQVYVDCRQAWQEWQPGDKLPHGARVVPYDGFIPEVFLKEIVCQQATNTVGLSLSSTPSVDPKTRSES